MTVNRRFKAALAAVALMAAVGTGTVLVRPLVVEAKSGDTFSHSFQKASAEEVLAWMQKQGIQVKFDGADLPSRELSFAFAGVGKDDLVQSVGEMLGMRTQKRGSVYSLLKGVGSDGSPEPLGSEDFGQSKDCGGAFFLGPDGFEFDFDELPMLDDQQMKWEFGPDSEFLLGDFMGQDGASLVDEIMKTLEEAGVFSGKKMTEDQKAELKAKLKERIAKSRGGRMFAMPEGFEFKLAPMGPDGKFKVFEWGPEHMKEFSGDHAKAMAELEKHMAELQRRLGEHKLSKEQIEELKALQGKEHAKAMEHLKKAMEELEESGALRKLDKEQIEKLKAERRFFDDEAFKKSMEEMRKHLGENMKVLQIKLENLKKFIASLTPEQKALATKQGYLRPEDLTKEQRELLGIGEEGGEVDMTFQIDGEKVVIKSKGGVITL